MLILAGVAISALNSDEGMFTKIKESAFVSEMKSYEEATSVNKLNNSFGETLVVTNVGLTGQPSIKTVIPNIKEKYENEIIVQNDIMYYFYTGTEESKQRVSWCFKHSIPVWGYSNYEDFVLNVEEIPTLQVAESRYVQKGNIFMQSPDISKLNPKCTFYLVPNETSGNLQLAGRIDQVEEPENWYDYENKNWANIVTANGSEVAYWVWIPRYKYLADTANEFINAKFVNTDDVCTLVNESNQPYNFDVTGYNLSEAFIFDNKQLTGYWLSKYEISEVTEIFRADASISSITVTSTTVSQSVVTDEYTVYLNGVEKYTGTLPYELTGLTENKEYNIWVTKNNTLVYNDYIKTKPIEIDMSMLNQNCTYYVYWDENGIEHNDIPISQPAPANWYNYAEKRWANILTVNENDVAYWVYIPRYEYRAYEHPEVIDVKFIPKEQVKARDGYSISEAFTFAGKELPGYWLSKYEVSEVNEVYGIAEGIDSYTISLTNASQTIGAEEYKVIVDGELKYTGTMPCTITGFAENTTHRIRILKASKLVFEGTRTTKSIEIDLSTLNPACTFYLTWDEGGNEILTPISQSAPANWYNYAEKRWANIVTKGENGDVIAYWVYIPRYEYRTHSTSETVEVRLIPKGQVTPDPGYEISEAFTFAGKQLPGYWLSKYEVSEK